MNTTAINPMQFIHTAGVRGFIGLVQGGGLNPALAFGAIGAGLDRYAGSAPSRDYPRELRSLIAGLPKGDISSDLQDRVLGSIDAHRAVVEKAARICAINAEAPFDPGAEWRWIPEGEFKMGSAKDDPYRYDNEKTLETTMTGGFFMLDHTPSNAEFKAWLDAIGSKDVRDLERRFAGDRQPAVEVIHEEATSYSRWLGEKIVAGMGVSVIGRLPFEEEWEKAAKGPGGNEFISPATHKQAHLCQSDT